MRRSSRRPAKWFSFFGFFGALLAAAFVFFGQKPNEEEQVQLRLKRNLEHRVRIADSLKDPFQQLNFPDRMSVRFMDQPQNVRVTYTIDPALQAEADKLLKQYKPDYGAVFMMDARTGRVLAYTSYQRDAGGQPVNLVSRASYPAASVFKIITAAAAIDRKGLAPSHTIRFNGGNYTLYKKNVMSDRITRWTRTITMRDAFAHSYNTAFGRLSLEKLAPEDINEYATRFMFNQPIISDFPVDTGVAVVPTEKNFEMTEIASGYNKHNRMSPVQGAMIAATVVNDGRMVMPYVVDRVVDEATGQEIYRGETVDNGSVVSANSAAMLREMMSDTVSVGTARRSFRPLVRDRKFSELEIGGKTGHLTGDNPRGRVDWFVGYATDEDRRIAVAALTVNKEFWTVKSAHLANVLIRRSFEGFEGARKRSVSNER